MNLPSQPIVEVDGKLRFQLPGIPMFPALTGDTVPRSTLDESFEIKVRNRKTTPVEVRVVEHLYRWLTWQIVSNSMPYRKTDSRTIEFLVPLAPDEEKTVTYEVRYAW